MGLKKGEKIQRIRKVQVVSVRAERLDAISQADVVREGFPDWGPERFIEMLVQHYRVAPGETVNRIEFCCL